MRARGALLWALAAAGALALVAAASAAGLPAAGGDDGVGNPEHLVKMLVYAGIALFFSFLCSVAEAVLLSVSPSFIARARQQGKPGADLLQRIKASIDRSLAAILTLNTIAHTLGAGGAGAEAASYFGERWVGVSMAVLTLAILFLSEIVPKTLGAVYWRGLAGATARFVQILIWALYPLIWISEILTRLVTRGKKVHVFSREEYTALADVGVERGQIQIGESRILKNLFRLPQLTAADIMTPRTVVFSLARDLTLQEVVDRHPKPRFSRIPTWGDTHDDVRGFVLHTEILLETLLGNGGRRLSELERPIRAVAETTSLETVLETLLENQQHLLLVLDEYGGVAGVVSLEDLVETLIGIEIVDEADEIDDLRKLAREKWQERMRRLGIDPD
ncbi:MAG: CNNM domain-containing protein [Acidobacteriota bacterium]|nr:CNNM domain-containing protein [Acidobacteriota bacterium]